MTRLIGFLLLLATLLLPGCATLRPEPPDVQLTGLTINDLSLTHANFLATLSLYNPNRTALDIEGLQFELFLKDIRIARGATAKSFSIPAEQTGSAALRLSTSFLDLLRLAQKLKGLNQVPFRVAGEIRIGGPGFTWVTIPISSEGAIPLDGALGEIFTGPEEFWRQPDRLVPEGVTAPNPTTPAGR